MKTTTPNRPGRPKVGSTLVGVKIPPDELAEIDAWIGRQPKEMSRPEALRRLAKIALLTLRTMSRRGA